jgi:ATP-dependent RNA/DNA helicase, senataxin
VTHVLDIHADVIVNVAFSPLKNTRPWQSARAAGRRLLGHALGFDASHVEAIIFQISDVVQQQTSSSGDKRKHDLKEPILRTQIWKKMYETIGGNDSEGLTLLISLVARSAHLDTLSSDAFNPAGLPTEIRKNIASIIVAVNAGLHSIRAGFLDAITQYTNATSSTAPVVRSLLCRQDMAKHVLALLLSPVEELQMASQILLGQAFDVDLRSDCLRAMLKDLPVPTLNGIATAVSTFNDCAPLFPDACNIAKSLVRCMTDVIEVLTNGRDGLLFDGQFVGVSEGDRPQMRLPKLWRLMCGAITIIFRRTPTWSKVNEPDAMIDWMRDALIFARDLVAQRRTFEAAVLLLSQQSETTMASPRKPSQIGHNMLNDLQPVLTESIRWLRLTDMELLHQSSNLVQTLMDCFRETGVRPSQDSLAKLEKFLDTSRRKSIPQNLQTRLSETHLSELATALSFFSQEDDDDEIQYIGESKPSFSHGSTLARAENSRIQDSKLRQRKMDDFMATTSKPPGKTPSSLGLKPFVEIRRAVKPATHPNSLMAQVRSQVAAQGKATVAGGSRLVHKPEASSKFSHGRPTLKDETRSTKPGISQSSSSASSASEDEAGGGGLASLGKLQKSPLVKKPAHRRTVKLMDTHFTGRNSALDRIHKREEAQRAALRMKPDLQPLHHAILSWNYDHEGPEPQMLGDRSSYMTVMDQFESDQEYQRTFEPLLILECWSQLIKSKEEAVPETLTCKVTSRQYMDKWLDLDVSVTDRPPDRWRLAETDIVLLRESGSKNSTLAKVQSSNSNPFQIQATLRCLVNFNAADPGLSINTQLRLTKVFRSVLPLYSRACNDIALSLSTIAREYAALKALPYYDFHHQVMRPRPADIPQLPAAQIEQAMKAYQVNEPQAIAILGSMRTDGFSLVQGYIYFLIYPVHLVIQSLVLPEREKHGPYVVLPGPFFLHDLGLLLLSM